MRKLWNGKYYDSAGILINIETNVYREPSEPLDLFFLPFCGLSWVAYFLFGPTWVGSGAKHLREPTARRQYKFHRGEFFQQISQLILADYSFDPRRLDLYVDVKHQFLSPSWKLYGLLNIQCVYKNLFAISVYNMNYSLSNTNWEFKDIIQY